ncbi:MAG: hypothetical protein DLM62_01780, partial [Pseudonocardiales bacterium]
MTDLDPAQIQAVEARIATELARLAHPRQPGGQPLAPAPYVRRHLSEHAAAGHHINDHILPRTFLPYVDLPRLRAALGATDGTMRLPLLPALRRASHLWNYTNPEANDTALHMWASALRLTDAEPGDQSPWRIHWAQWQPGDSEIVGRHTDGVVAVATTTLDGRQVAVTGSDDDTVRVWDLGTGRPIGDPLT